MHFLRSNRFVPCVLLLCLFIGGSVVLHGCASPTSANASASKNARQPGVKDADAPDEFSVTPSGLKYRILRKSDGRQPTADNNVSVNYKGWLDNGDVFDSSYDRGESIDFPLSGVIAGWTEGLQLIGEGGMIELEIPSSLGYGPQGMPGAIPPNATLHFIVELLKVR